MKYLTLIAAAAVSLLSACAGSPIANAGLSLEELAQLQPDKLCDAYLAGKRFTSKDLTNLRAELESRGTVKRDEWADVDAGTIWIGMNEAALICARGRPSHINETLTARGNRKQWVYRDCSDCKAKYVYTTNGIIDAIQK